MSTDDVDDLSFDDIRRAILLAWEQKAGRRPYSQGQNQQAKKLSNIQQSDGPPSFQQQQEGSSSSQRGNGRGRGRGRPRGRRGGKDKRDTGKVAETSRPPTPASSGTVAQFEFGGMMSPMTLAPPTKALPPPPKSFYPSVNHARSLASRLGVRPTISTLKTLELGHYDQFDERPRKRAREEEAKPPQGVAPLPDEDKYYDFEGQDEHDEVVSLEWDGENGDDAMNVDMVNRSGLASSSKRYAQRVLSDEPSTHKQTAFETVKPSKPHFGRNTLDTVRSNKSVFASPLLTETEYATTLNEVNAE